jgi:5-methylcytosine-specific restriction endonuclease McrA
MKTSKSVHGKACNGCGGTLRYPSGGCVACTRATAKVWDAAHPERKRAFSAKARVKDPEYSRKWARENPEKRRASVQRWRSRNLTKVREDRVRWVANNLGRASALTRAWQLTHPDKAKAIKATRRARKLGAVAGCRKEYTAYLKWARTEPAIACHYCNRTTLPKERHVDHYIPLSKGGDDSVANLRIACAKCNRRKHALMPETFEARIA